MSSSRHTDRKEIGIEWSGRYGTDRRQDEIRAPWEGQPNRERFLQQKDDKDIG